jgi:beta-phosphoglucomutase
MRAISELDLGEFEVAAFDWDGTLVDSPQKYRELDQRFVREVYGVEESIDKLDETFHYQWNNYQGNDFWADYYQFIDQTYGNGRKPLEVLLAERAEMLKEAQSTFEYKPGAADIVRGIQKNHTLRLALATASEREDIDFVANNLAADGEASLLEKFDLTLTLEDCENMKPHPEVYQKIISHFAIDKSGLLVFEDSHTGVLSAKSAGATVVNVVDGFSAAKQSEIDRISDFQIYDWQELEEIVLR